MKSSCLLVLESKCPLNPVLWHECKTALEHFPRSVSSAPLPLQVKKLALMYIIKDIIKKCALIKKCKWQSKNVFYWAANNDQRWEWRGEQYNELLGHRGFGHSCPMCPINMVEDISSSLGARGLGIEQPGTPDSDPAPASSGLAQQLPSSGLTSQLLSSGNKQAGTEEFKFCIFMSVKQRLFPPLPSDSHLPHPLTRPSAWRCLARPTLE